MGRPSWDEYFMSMARLAAARSTCSSRQVGAVIVFNHRVLSTGYNGAPSGLPHCLNEGCLEEDGKCIRSIHAEANAILQAARYGIAIEGAAIYTTCRPCKTCSLLIAGSGLARVVHDGEFSRDEPQRKMLTDSGIIVQRVENVIMATAREVAQQFRIGEERMFGVKDGDLRLLADEEKLLDASIVVMVDEVLAVLYGPILERLEHARLIFRSELGGVVGYFRTDIGNAFLKAYRNRATIEPFKHVGGKNE